MRAPQGLNSAQSKAEDEMSIQHPKRQPWDITAAQKKALKAQGHALKAIVWVGQKGLTESVVNAVIQALKDHELIKVSMSADNSNPKIESQELAKLTGSHVCQNIGRIALSPTAHTRPSDRTARKVEAPPEANETTRDHSTRTSSSPYQLSASRHFLRTMASS